MALSGSRAWSVGSRMSSYQLASLVTKLNISPVKRIEFSFDPFGTNVRSCRDALFHLYSNNVRVTNVNCILKVNVKSDRSDPNMNVIFNDGLKVLFKTNNLTTLELLRTFDNMCRERIIETDKDEAAPKEEAPKSKSKKKKR
ncbi:39S ribosomal protein L53, mitochondrial-like [Lingula anatina]|uniref:Large ribosomal subunit protein mL53 n=1 Tax=Lingula anatina TaxID=7574 RepID=A0A1S3IT53_LINAN|nr:39S ribosomal protein L53, mitochondrial-like [Lingula anatina]|eukprot:XP_013400714.1 39S ribosomal protein L53, mitochondrial-like [Lingula anatina]